MQQPDLGPPEFGNEDPAFLSLLDRAAVNAGQVCMCAHTELDHWSTVSGDTSCMHRPCGCQVFRPDPRAPSPEAAS